MKRLIIFLLPALLILTTACSKENPINQHNFKKYPDSLGKEWEYETINVLVFYDSSGIIYGNDTIFNGNTIARVGKVNDSLGSYNDLILFISFDLTTPANVNSIWYRNADEGFYAIAYSNPASSQLILPKKNLLFSDEILARLFRKAITPMTPNLVLINSEDSIQYYDSPRKVLSYPLYVGSSWVELNSPLYIKRFVNKKEEIVTSAGTFNCYVVESGIKEFPNTSFRDYINLDAGLILREVKVDSMLHIGYQGDTLGFLNSISVSELIRRN